MTGPVGHVPGFAFRRLLTMPSWHHNRGLCSGPGRGLESMMLVPPVFTLLAVFATLQEGKNPPV